MKTSIALHLTVFLLALTAVLVDSSENGFSISYFSCNDTRNPISPSNTKVRINSVCNMKLTVTSLKNEDEKDSGGSVAATVSLLMTNGIESIRANMVNGIDYWSVADLQVNLKTKGITEIDLDNTICAMPNTCGQSYMVARVTSADTIIDQSMPMQMDCNEETVDLALFGETNEIYNMYNHRPVIETSGQSFKHFVPGLKLYMKNVGNETFSSKTGMSAIQVIAYAKTQDKKKMFEWDVNNQSWQADPHFDLSLLDYQLGDVMLAEGNMVSIQNGRGTPPLPSGYQIPLDINKLKLTSKMVCGNAVMVVKLSTMSQPADSNMINNYYLCPIFISCWGKNPVKTRETCQVIPNYYDGGQTAWITYTVPGKTTVYEYKSNDRSIRQLKPVEDEQTLQDITNMKVQTDIHSQRLMELGQCVESLWGSSDSFVTSLDVLCTSIRKLWADVKPENSIQDRQYSKVKLILGTVCDLLALMLQPHNELHTWLHVPFQAVYNPQQLPNNGHPESNRVKRDTQPSNVSNETTGQSLNFSTTSSPPVTDKQTDKISESSSTRAENDSHKFRDFDSSYTTTYTTASSVASSHRATANSYPSTASEGSAGITKESILSTSSPKTDSTTADKFSNSVTATSAPMSTQEKTTEAAVTQSLTGTPISNTRAYGESNTEEDVAFGPQHPLHRIIGDFIANLAQTGGEQYCILSPERWYSLSKMIKAFLFGLKPDLDCYLHIPETTRNNLVEIFQMVSHWELPRFVDNIPNELIETMTTWFSKKLRNTHYFGSAVCDYDEGLTLALNKTEELLHNDGMKQRRDQLKLISNVIQVLAGEDHKEYYARLLLQIRAANARFETSMIRDDVLIQEPFREDVYCRCAATKQWELRKNQVFQFAANKMSPEQYKSVFWNEKNGVISQGVRCDLTGQVFWTKVAICSCPQGDTCDLKHTSGSSAPAISPKVAGVAMLVKNEASVNIGSNDEGSTHGSEDHQLDAEEDLIFSN